MDKNSFYRHLTEKIIPFWEKLRDDEFGGYYGYLDYDLKLDKKAVKGCILNSRIMWFFSNAYMSLKTPELLDYAKHAYDFMCKYCLDYEYGGVLWSVNYDGSIADSIKHTYNQAFSIYALSSYYDASGNNEAFEKAYELACLIEERCTDEIGYLEAFNRDFTPAENDKLSENGVMAEKTMNTLLHVFEAYTELLRVIKKREAAFAATVPEDLKAREAMISGRLKFMMDIVADKVYNPELKRQEVFFDKNYNSIIDLHSYGHDIEAAWLMDRGCTVLDDAEYTAKLRPITDALGVRILNRAYTKHSLLNECEKGVDNTHRIWWVQAEAVIGFYNAYQKLIEEKCDAELAERFHAASEDIWDFIQNKLTDKREGSEWFWELDENGEPFEGRPIVEPWKCPYHNGRMCLEMLRRTEASEK
ncbi:MAG: AGE family epimerase/isomerase [Lachnospiraceae bacterium]|nr:AGE family epimerase/isomerase [Lachnospiraceae bacterium]